MPPPLHPVVAAVTQEIAQRSRDRRENYLESVDTHSTQPLRGNLSCTNLAHALAAEDDASKQRLGQSQRPNLGIVTAYNDMLSAHQPFSLYPAIIKEAALAAGATAQVAGGVPAMCDGVTQGQPGMELSLFSREVIALGTAVALSHGVFDATMLLGVCDKIVPGLVIGALSYGHLPAILVPAGPMTSGIAHKEKAIARQRFAKGEIDRHELLKVESQAYHAAGTCTFYGTANSNQMLMEIMGLHVPGTAFVNPNTPLRHQLTQEAARRAVAITAQSGNYRPLGRVLDERSFVNGMVGLLASGGSTNLVIHLPAMARAAGLILTLDDIARLSAVVPLLARVYPNGQADVNQFHASGGLALVIKELLKGGLLHRQVGTVAGDDLAAYTQEPYLDQDNRLTWRSCAALPLDTDIVRTLDDPFAQQGGLSVLDGNLGRAIIKTSAVDTKHHCVEAPARVFDDQESFLQAFKAGQLNTDFIAVLRFQGPAANGMPELHKLTPALGVIQDRGYQVALVTDGRMSGASGKVPAAIHLSPEAQHDGPIARIHDGDIIRLDAQKGTLNIHLAAPELRQRRPAPAPDDHNPGAHLFRHFRATVTSAEEGATVCL